MVWNNGVFDSKDSLMRNSIWLNGTWESGTFRESAFNPNVWRFNPIDGSVPYGTDIVNNTNRLAFNIYPYDIEGNIASGSQSVPNVWVSGKFESG